MRFDAIAPDVFLFRGEALDSNATALRDGKRVLLIDGLGSRADAAEMRGVIEREWESSVEMIVATHYFSDHMAAYALFPNAPVVAHAYARHTFASEDFRTAEETEHFVEPSFLLDGSLSLRWGRNRVEIFPNPGHTMGTLNVDLEDAGLLHVGDTLVGNIGYFWYTSPDLLDRALARARGRGRARILASHGGVRDARAIDRARTYLSNLEWRVREAREREEKIARIPLADCLVPGLPPGEFEEPFHSRNLASVAARGLFSEARSRP
jgi:cyclase